MQNKHKKALTNVFTLLIIAIETQSNATQPPVSDDTEQHKEVNGMLTKNEQKTLERLADMMQRMDEMQKAQLCAFTEGLAMALEHSKRAS